MKVHKLIRDGIDDIIKEKATKVGLDQLDFDKNYRLYKVRNNAELICVGQGKIRLTGSEKHVSIHICSLREWFRTCSVLSCKYNNDRYTIETGNTVYELVEDE